MNLKVGNISITISIWFKFAGYAAVTVAGLLLYYHYAVSFNAIKISQLSEGVEALKNKSARYHNFIETSRKTQQEKEITEGLIAGYSNVMAGAEKSQNTFLDQINEVAVQSKIELDRITPQEGGGSKYWDISFTADYGSICKFFTMLEKYFKIERFSIAGGQTGPREAVNANLSALASKISLSGSGNEDEKREIFDLYNVVAELLKNIEEKEAKGVSSQLLNKLDPMSLSDTIFLPEKKKEEAKKFVIERPHIKIESIFWDPSTPVVVIAGSALKEGEEYNDIKIVKINEDNVIVLWRGRKFEMRK